MKNGTGICWAKSCLLAALLRGNGIPSGISYQKLTRADDARGNKATVHARFSLEKEILAFTARPEFAEIDYKDNNPDLDKCLVEILHTVDVVMNIRTDFDLKL